MKLVSLVTINLNQDKVTEALLNSLFEKNTYPDIEIIVVDNASKINLFPNGKSNIHL